MILMLTEYVTTMKSQDAKTTQRVTTTLPQPTLTEAAPTPLLPARPVPVKRMEPVLCSQMMMMPMASAMMTKSKGARTTQHVTTTLQLPTLTEAVPTRLTRATRVQEKPMVLEQLWLGLEIQSHPP